MDVGVGPNTDGGEGQWRSSAPHGRHTATFHHRQQRGSPLSCGGRGPTGRVPPPHPPFYLLLEGRLFWRSLPPRILLFLHFVFFDDADSPTKSPTFCRMLLILIIFSHGLATSGLVSAISFSFRSVSTVHFPRLFYREGRAHGRFTERGNGRDVRRRTRGRARAATTGRPRRRRGRRRRGRRRRAKKVSGSTATRQGRRRRRRKKKRQWTIPLRGVPHHTSPSLPPSSMSSFTSFRTRWSRTQEFFQ